MNGTDAFDTRFGDAFDTFGEKSRIYCLNVFLLRIMWHELMLLLMIILEWDDVDVGNVIERDDVDVENDIEMRWCWCW